MPKQRMTGPSRVTSSVGVPVQLCKECSVPSSKGNRNPYTRNASPTDPKSPRRTKALFVQELKWHIVKEKGYWGNADTSLSPLQPILRRKNTRLIAAISVLRKVQPAAEADAKAVPPSPSIPPPTLPHLSPPTASAASHSNGSTAHSSHSAFSLPELLSSSPLPPILSQMNPLAGLGCGGG